MRKVLLLVLFKVMVLVAGAQSTFYWVGGANGDWTAETSWNTASNGTGSSRTVPNSADVLIFDATGAVTPVFPASFDIGQLKLLNGSFLTLRRNGGATGTSTLRILGDGDNATADFLVDGSSTITLNNTVASYSIAVNIGVATTNLATGSVFGTATVSGTSTSRFASQNAGALTFEPGSIFYSNLNAGSNYAFGSSTHGVAQGVVFKSGSTLIYQGGSSPFANTSTYHPVKFDAGSTMVFEASENSGIFSNRTFADVIIRPASANPSTPITVTVNGNVYNVNNLTIQPNATFNLQTTGVFAVSGNIINNGTFGAASSTGSSNLLMVGFNAIQTIGGTGNFNALGALSVGTDADVVLNRSIVLNGTTNSSVTGKLNLQNNTVSGNGSFQSRSPQTVANTPATVTVGSQSIVIDAAYYSGTGNTANVAVGLLVTGSGIAPNTYIIGTNSGSSTITISKPATAGGSAITISGNAPTLALANSGGVDAAINTATRSFGSNTNYVFNAPSISPFSLVSDNSVNNLDVNADIVLNRNVTVNGTVSLLNAILTIPINDTLRITSGNGIAGTTSLKHVVVQVDKTTGEQGALRMDNLVSATLFPVGDGSNYLPVTINPVTVSDFAVTVFQGITTDGSPNGPAYAPKQNVVDAVWNVSRINGSGDASLTMGWPLSLEGSNFSPQYHIGIMHHESGSWGNVVGAGSNSTNTATASFSTFSPFAVAANPATLPVHFNHVAAARVSSKIKIDWSISSDVDIRNYQVEKSTNGRFFNAIGTVEAKRITGNHAYAFIDDQPHATNFYRIKSVGINGDVQYSSILKVTANKSAIQVYPNPVADVLSLTGLPSNALVRILHTSGAVVQLFHLPSGNSATTISLGHLEPGTYILQVSGAENVTNTMIQKL